MQEEAQRGTFGLEQLIAGNGLPIFPWGFRPPPGLCEIGPPPGLCEIARGPGSETATSIGLDAQSEHQVDSDDEERSQPYEEQIVGAIVTLTRPDLATSTNSGATIVSATNDAASHAMSVASNEIEELRHGELLHLASEAKVWIRTHSGELWSDELGEKCVDMLKLASEGNDCKYDASVVVFKNAFEKFNASGSAAMIANAKDDAMSHAMSVCVHTVKELESLHGDTFSYLKTSTIASLLVLKNVFDRSQNLREVLVNVLAAIKWIKQGKANRKSEQCCSFLYFREAGRILQNALNCFERKGKLWEKTTELYKTAHVYCCHDILQIEEHVKKGLQEVEWWKSHIDFIEDHAELADCSFMDLLKFHSECVLRFDNKNKKALIRWSHASLNREICDERAIRQAESYLERARKLKEDDAEQSSDHPKSGKKKRKKHQQRNMDEVVTYESAYELLLTKKKLISQPLCLSNYL